MRPPPRKCIAFTLAEVLITLGIIAVVAALTLAPLIQKHREKETVSKLKKAYSLISQAHLSAIEEYGTPDNWDLKGFRSGEGALNILNNWTPYLKFNKNCGTSRGCIPNSNYKTLNNGNMENYNSADYAKAILSDGMIIVTFVLDSSCTTNRLQTNGGECGSAAVDINGFKGPNTYGKDLFRFYIMKNKIVPSGIPSTDSYYNFNTSCLGTSDLVGSACTAWVLYNENMDYLHCDDLSWDGKKTCK